MGGRTSSSGMGGGLITNRSADFGKPGTYELYRAGNLDAPNGMIFLDSAFDEASWYVTNPISKSQPHTVEEYQLQIESPIYVHAKDKATAVLEAWRHLHPGEEPKVKISQRDGKTHMSGTDWQKIDRQNARALAKSGHDAIIITDDDGHHEIQIHKSSASRLTKKGSTNVHTTGLEPPKTSGGMWHYTSDGYRFEYTYKKGKGWTLAKTHKFDSSSRRWESHDKPIRSYSSRNPFNGKTYTVEIPKRISESVGKNPFELKYST